MEAKHKIQLYIQSQTADAAPPLGTILGNLGVNTVNFCKEFNQFTKDLPAYFTVSTEILIFANRTYKFTTKAPPLGSILRLLAAEREIKRNGKVIKQTIIPLKSIIQISKWKFPQLNLSESLPIILGVAKSFNLIIIK